MRTLKVGVSQPLFENFIENERGAFYFSHFFVRGSVKLLKIKLYNINDDYIESISKIDSKIAFAKIDSRSQSRKYIGIILEINGLKYFANLSSYKPYKHDNMTEKVDFVKIGKYAVVNLNNMLPVPEGEYFYVDFNNIKDKNYVNLLRNEYRIILKKSEKIIRNANIVYKHKIENGNDTPLARRCCDFLRLEKFAVCYKSER